MTSVLPLALAYCRRGWAPIPVPLGHKAPSIPGWPELRITTPDVRCHFNGSPINIGVLLGKPSGGLTDIDLDCSEALPLAGRFLPATDAIFGRPKKPRSHRLYVAPGANSLRFADPLGGMLVELRSTGAMTIFPGSVHPSGDAIAWEINGQPATVDVAALAAACGRLATACLIVRYIAGDALDLPAENWPALLESVDPRLAEIARGWLRHTVTPDVEGGVTEKSQRYQKRHTCHTCHTVAEANARAAVDESHGDGAKQQPHITGAQRKYALAALESEATDVARTKPGNQSNRLNEAARKMVEFVAAGALSADEVRQSLSAATAEWQNDPDRKPWTSEEILRVIDSGLGAGMEHPPRDLSGIGPVAGADSPSDSGAKGCDGPGEPPGRDRSDGVDGAGDPRDEPQPAPTPADGAGGEGAAAGGESAAGTDDQQDAPDAASTASTDGRHFVSFGRYQMTAAGLYYADNNARVWLCSPFEVLAQTRDANGSDWGLLLRWSDNDGQTHDWAMPKEALGGRREEVYRTFLREGLSIASSIEHRNKLADYLSGVPVHARARCVSRVGWHETRTGYAYVLPDETIVGGDLADERVLLQTEHRIESYYKVAGTVDDWRLSIGKLCIGNSRLVVAVSAAFAAPLLELVDEPSSGLHFLGNSQTGKTTVLHVAGSVWGGGGKNGFLNTWRATSNGLEGIAEGHCDGLLALDEMAEVDGREAGEIAYMLANGQGKNRARRDGSARRPAQWRLVFLSSGEISLADKIMEAGKKSRAGQEVRLVPVQADAGAGMGMFENLHGASTAAAFADELRQAALSCYGAPIRTYVSMLTAELAEDRAQVRAEIKAARDEFISLHLPTNASPQVRSVCGRFGLIAAAGSLATAFGLTGWPDKEADRAAAACFRAWLERRGSTGDHEIEEGIRQVRAFLEKHGLSRFETVGENGREIDNELVYNRAGYRRRMGDGAWQYMVLPEQWNSEIAKGHDHRALARAMVKRGLIISDSERKSQRPERIGGRTMRVYVFAPHILDGEKEPSNAGE